MSCGDQITSIQRQRKDKAGGGVKVGAGHKHLLLQEPTKCLEADGEDSKTCHMDTD